MELVLIIVAATLVDNIFTNNALGITSAVKLKHGPGEAFRMGFLVMMGIVVTTAISYPLDKLILSQYHVESLRVFLFILIAVAVGHFLSQQYEGGNFLFSVNCAMLGVALINAGGGYTYVQAICAALGAGVGFIISMVIFAGAVEKTDKAEMIPKAFKGLPIYLIIAAIMALAFSGFAGMITV